MSLRRHEWTDESSASDLPRTLCLLVEILDLPEGDGGVYHPQVVEAGLDHRHSGREVRQMGGPILSRRPIQGFRHLAEMDLVSVGEMDIQVSPQTLLDIESGKD